jgi:hypothetical protein
MGARLRSAHDKSGPELMKTSLRVLAAAVGVFALGLQF